MQIDAPFAGYGYVEDNDMTVAHSEIAEQLQHYLKGASSEPSEATLRKVFHPSTVLKGLRAPEGAYAEIEGEAFLGGAGGKPPLAAGLEYHKILRIDKAGKDVAAATVMFVGGGQVYMDHLSLLKLEGSGWTIVQKTFAGQPFEVPAA